VKEGDHIKARHLLVRLDDTAELAELEQIKAQSQQTVEIEAAEASLAQKKVYFKRLEWAEEQGAATDLEVEQARLEVKIDELKLKMARFEHEQTERKYKEAQIRVNRMRLKSPVTGRVEKVEVEVGESINALDDVIRVIRTDPLWIDVHVPLEKGKTLGVNHFVKIGFPDADIKTVKGKIIFISTFADAASETLRARIEVPNKSNRPAGEYIRVLFSNRE
jgi:cobalt-zinc-cadmium efflux system membrane fusion protein